VLAAAERPNFVFIYTDDQAEWTLGASGNRQAHTPHLDALAREGARFTNAFVTTPVCSPARASLFASRYGTELGVLDFITAVSHRAYTPETGDGGLEARFVTFPSLLQDAGYRTALFGKWHLGDWSVPRGAKYHPTRHGFGHFFGFIAGGGPPADPTIEVEGQPRAFQGLTDDILTDAAIAYIRENRGAPFYVHLALRSPHAKWLPVAPEDWAPFADREIALPTPAHPDLKQDEARRMMREYLASVAGVDRNVGRIVAALEELDLTRDTVVLFSSDHGYNVGHHGIWHKGNGYWLTHTLPPATPHVPARFRPNLFDTSLRTPLVIRWPGHIAAGREIPETVTQLDLYPTLLELAGVPVPRDAGIRGRSLGPLLRGERPVEWNNDLYAEYSMRVYARADLRAWRTARWKLVRDFLNPDRDELYDLAADPAESVNLVADPRSEVQAARRELERRMHEAMLANHDPILIPSHPTP
jgi:arylsulfatase A-like enzyme